MKMDDAALEAPLAHELEVCPHTVGQCTLAATHHDRVEEEVVFVDEACRDRLASELGTTYRDVRFRSRFELSDRIRAEVTLDPRPRARYRLERSGVDDLFGGLPDLREVANGRQLLRDGAHGLPGDHRLVHPAPVEVCGDRPLEVIDKGMHLVVGCRPIELAVLILDIPVERGDRRIDQLGHATTTALIRGTISPVHAGQRRAATAVGPMPCTFLSTYSDT